MIIRCSLCAYFEKFSSFVEWTVKQESNSQDLDHYMEEFVLAGKPGISNCQILMGTFYSVCRRLNVPVVDEKTFGPSTTIEYLGLSIDTQKMVINIPKDKNLVCVE